MGCFYAPRYRNSKCYHYPNCIRLFSNSQNCRVVVSLNFAKVCNFAEFSLINVMISNQIVPPLQIQIQPSPQERLRRQRHGGRRLGDHRRLLRVHDHRVLGRRRRRGRRSVSGGAGHAQPDDGSLHRSLGRRQQAVVLRIQRRGVESHPRLAAEDIHASCKSRLGPI